MVLCSVLFVKEDGNLQERRVPCRTADDQDLLDSCLARTTMLGTIEAPEHEVHEELAIATTFLMTIFRI